MRNSLAHSANKINCGKYTLSSSSLRHSPVQSVQNKIRMHAKSTLPSAHLSQHTYFVPHSQPKFRVRIGQQSNETTSLQKKEQANEVTLKCTFLSRLCATNIRTLYTHTLTLTLLTLASRIALAKIHFAVRTTSLWLTLKYSTTRFSRNAIYLRYYV